MGGSMKDRFLDGDSGIQLKNMPTASKALLGVVIQFIGTAGTYISNYFYKCIGTAIASIISAAIGESAGITSASVVKATFEAMRDETGQYIFDFRESIANAAIGESTGITSASVVKATFEELITESGAYDFAFTDSLISAGIGASTGITSASVVKATFESQIDETSENTFVYHESEASASIGESAGITEATVNKATFESEITVPGDHAFVFDGTDWKLGEDVVTLADYGIVATGTAQLNDTITISYVAEKWTLSDVEVDLADYGISFEGTPADTDTIVITYTQSKWELESTVVDLVDYGISFAGTPIDGDIITVNYTSDNWYLEDEIVDLSDYGISIVGTPAYADTVVVDYTSAYTLYFWDRVDVQPNSILVVALLSITTAPGGTFAIGSKYYKLATKKIITATATDSWEGATESDPTFGIVYSFNGLFYEWDGNSLEQTDINLLEFVANKTSELGQSEQKYMTQKGVTDAVGAKQDILSTASKTVEGKVRFGTGAEIVEGQSEIVTVSAKDLKDRGAEFQQLPFSLQEDVLNSTAKLVTQNANFFIYSNGDVSIDGKTIIKTNTLVPNIINMVASENYLVVIRAEQYYNNIYVYSISSDGTLTLARTIEGISAGMLGSGIYKWSYADGKFVLGVSISDVYGFIIFTDATIVSGDVINNTVGTWDFQIGYVQGQWCLVYESSGLKLKKSTNIANVLSATPISLGTAGNNTLTLDDIDSKLVALTSEGSTTNRIIQVDLTTESISIDIIVDGNLYNNNKIIKFNNKYYLLNESRGYWKSANIIGFAGAVTGGGTDISVKGTSAVITQNSDDVLLSKEIKIPILKVEATTGLPTGDITLANVAENSVYKYGAVDSLTITACAVSDRKSIVYFSTSASFTTFTPPTAQPIISTSATVIAERSYKLIFENGIMEVVEFGIPS